MKKEYRVKKSKEIEEILKRKRFSSNSYFIIYVKEQNETSHFRYAMSVSKKIGDAVIRNRLKRQIRAIMRNFTIKNGYDLFIIARNPIKSISFLQMSDQLEFLLQKQKLLVKGENNDTIFKTK
ncbi:MAG: ribonuclease P protein component [Anaeroplasmataceae bacterium]|nr:ribonuclease P protein component [Anaeroplasmataceae bacterium]